LKKHLQCKKECLPKQANISRNALLVRLERERVGKTKICDICNKVISKANYARHQLLFHDKHKASQTSITQHDVASSSNQHNEQEDDEQDDEQIDEEDETNDVVTETVVVEQERKRKKKKHKVSSGLRQAVWTRYVGFEHGETPCLCCKTTRINPFTFHCGHVVASANGGQLTIDNIRPICSGCNCSMGATNMREYAAKYFNVTII
jgi:hypothetical protein